jgi:hypothetical protein
MTGYRDFAVFQVIWYHFGREAMLLLSNVADFE